MAIINTLAAKTHFSRLMARAEAGEEVIIARAGVPSVRLVPVSEGEASAGARVFGADPSVRLPLDSPFFEELPEKELAAWE
ncbi:MAG: type II toxin-antitoxin system prevent-host-death family antitoxin [Bifidobacteriaceae bacterium]|jgi:prevent-host-death family protein|nr:type II toxin-antitoxin system prevent-host-death family antitoxin [Bifidobacteriaceae bacterium]